MTTYNEKSVKEELEKFPDWEFKKAGIEKKFVFKNFVDALAFIVKIGIYAEKQNHHPEITNVYNKVNIRLTTHDANGITKKDFDLARSIESVL